MTPAGSVRRRCAASGVVLTGLIVAWAAPLAAQVPTDTVPAEPLPPDTVQVEPLPPDPTQVEPGAPDSVIADTLQADTAGVLPDSLAQVTDTTGLVPDSLIFHELPAIPGGSRAGWERGVWVWGRQDMMGSRALTLGELLSEAPGIVPVRGGDYGAPSAVSAFGLGGGRIRVFHDGFELLGLDGGMPDLAHISLVGLEEVRLERGLGGLRIELTSHRIDDPRPVSGVQAGTGDLGTNYLRGTFMHPRALGGSFGAGLERLDTGGSRGAEPGSRTDGWFRFSMHRGDDAGLRLELRTAKNEFRSIRDTVPYPPEFTRRDLILRGRLRLAEGLVAEGFTGSSSVVGGGDDLTPIDISRRQHGLRLGFERDGWWARGGYRLISGPDLPSSVLDVEAGGLFRDIVGVSGRLARDTWAGRAATMTSVSAWTEPFFGVSAFASWEDGTAGSPISAARMVVVEEAPDGAEGDGQPGDGEDPPPEEPGPTHRFTERTGLRVGLVARIGPLDVQAAQLTFDVDSLVPLGFMADREGIAAPGGRFTGFEVSTELRFPLDGWSLYGSLTQFDQGTVYLPERAYEGALRYHGLPMESSENLEIWLSAGVQGRDPMLTSYPAEQGAPPPGLLSVPFEQSWYAFFQIRIVSVQAFFRFENVSIRQNNQDLPGRLLPQFRSMYGIRWVLWN